MSVNLPSSPLAKSATPRFIDMGGLQEGSLGGENIRINRLGSRWACDYVMPPMKADAARIWIARLIQGRQEKAVFYFPQPGMIGAAPASYEVYGAHPANGIGLTIAGSANALMKEGMFVSARKAGTNRRYIHQVRGDATLVGGRSTTTVQPPFRASFAAPDVIDLSALCYIEGYVVGDDTRWTIDDAKIYGLQFSIVESK